MKTNSVYILVQSGMVTDVYASDKNTRVVIIDRNQEQVDEAAEARNDAALKKARKLHCVA